MVSQHGPLALSSPTLKAIFRRYVFNEVLPSDDGMDAPGLYRRDSEPMLLVEHVWTSAEAFSLALQDPEYLATVRPDEEYLGREIVGRVPTAYHLEESIVFSSGNNGDRKVFDFLKKRSDVSDTEFVNALEDAAVGLRDDSDLRTVVHKRVHNLVQKTDSLYVASGKDYDAVIESWVSDYTAVSAFHAQLRAAEASFVDAQASFSLFAREISLFPG
jgi:hypothetical protein